MLNHERKSSVVPHVWILQNSPAAILTGFVILLPGLALKCHRAAKEAAKSREDLSGAAVSSLANSCLPLQNRVKKKLRLTCEAEKENQHRNVGDEGAQTANATVSHV